MSMDTVERKLAPLTEEWFRGALTPRHQEDGTRLYVLTPPRRDGASWPYVLGFAVILLAISGWFVGLVSR